MTPEGCGRAVALRPRPPHRECLAVALATAAAQWVRAAAGAVLCTPPVAIAWFLLG